MKLGVIGAMETEVELLKQRLCDARRVTAAGLEFFEGSLGATTCVVVRCGVGKVSAARCTQALIDLFDVTHVVNTGAAGSLDASIDIGDVVVATDCVQHDMDATFFGYAPGQVPQTASAFFRADARLREAALMAAREVAPDIAVHEGRVASGDRFVCDDAVKASIRETFSACCTEMEGAAIAQVCASNNIPFTIIRAISDKADGSDSIDYQAFEDKAAHDCSNITARMAELLNA